MSDVEIIIEELMDRFLGGPSAEEKAIAKKAMMVMNYDTLTAIVLESFKSGAKFGYELKHKRKESCHGQQSPCTTLFPDCN